MPGGRAGIARGRNNLRGRGEWLARLPPRQRTRLSGRQATQRHRPMRTNAESLHARYKSAAVGGRLSPVGGRLCTRVQKTRWTAVGNRQTRSWGFRSQVQSSVLSKLNNLKL
jgi:hypothetical protein